MKERINSVLHILIIVFFFASCQRKSMTVSEYCSFIDSRESEFVKEKTINGIVYTLKYRTNEFILLNQHHFRVIDNKVFYKELEEMSGQKYFILNIKDAPNNIAVKKALYDKEQYGNILGTLNESLLSNFNLKIGDEIIYPSVFNMDIPSSIKPELNILITFDNDLIKKDEGVDESQITFNDNIFNNGPVKFTFDRNDKNNSPILKL